MGAVGEREKEFAKNGLVFDEEAKLVYGIIFSLRNMVKKLSLRYIPPPTIPSYQTNSKRTAKGRRFFPFLLYHIIQTPLSPHGYIESFCPHHSANERLSSRDLTTDLRGTLFGIRREKPSGGG